MERNKDVYMEYVCPYCLNTLDNCTCDLFPPYHLIHIDRNIQEHIRILNNKGYRTMYCCEGHGAHTNTYIAFAKDYFKDIGIPDGFTYDKKGTTIGYIYPSKLTAEKIEEIKKEKLETLLNWCKGLPNRNRNANMEN